MNLLSTSKLSISIGSTHVCKDLTVECNAGEIWGVLGRNGKGKTTLLHSLAGLRDIDAGDIFIKNKNIKQLSRKQIAQQLGVLLQHHEDIFPGSVIETVISGRHPHIKPWQWESKLDYQLAKRALQAVQLTPLAERPINQLSGGERQRVSIATLITQNPDILLMDEPNSHLDLKYQIQLLDYLTTDSQKNQKLILMTLHDLNLAARYCDKIILLLGDGEVITGNTDELLNEDNLLRLYDYPVKRFMHDNKFIFSAR